MKIVPPISKNINYMCLGRCGLSYRECLKVQREDLKENAKGMNKCLSRNLVGLFSVNGPDRLYIKNYGAPGGRLQF